MVFSLLADLCGIAAMLIYEYTKDIAWLVTSVLLFVLGLKLYVFYKLGEIGRRLGVEA